MSLLPRYSHITDPRYGRFLEEFSHHGRGYSSNKEKHHPFQPTFDITEADDAYELYGELPGLDKENINIDFVEPQTLVIHGRIESPHVLPENTPAAASSQPDNAGGETDKPTHVEQSNPKAEVKFWVAERNFGDFSRTFTFPRPIQRYGVYAKLDKGILHVKIPKSDQPGGQRIVIE